MVSNNSVKKNNQNGSVEPQFRQRGNLVAFGIDVGLRSRDRPPYRYLIKVEELEKYRIEVLLGSQLHRRWPKVADEMIKDSIHR